LGIQVEFNSRSTENKMNGIEVLDPFAGQLPVTWNQTNVKEKQNIADIIKNYGSRLQGFIRKRVRTTEDADDILQDVYFQLLDADRLMKPIDQMSAWLFTVARNKITDLYRKKKPEPIPEYVSDTDGESLFAELNDLMFDNGSTPETDYLRSLVWTELDKALGKLPEEQRQVFEMTEMQGLSFKAISEQTGVPVNTLISRKRYAVLYLREQMLLIYDELINF
jgi:RNA polymerase sigma factor (sigma-70 family)